MQTQQGDVLLETISDVPKGATNLHHLRLAEGETTGHSHRVVKPVKGNAKLFEFGDRLILQIMGGDATVIHEEHKTITVPPGVYEVNRVREYDYDAEESRQIAD